MKTTLQVCIVFLLIWVPVYLLYWHVFRPIILTKLRYMMFECRDKIRMLAIKKKLGDDSVYEILESRCNASLNIVNWVNLIHFTRARSDKEINLKTKRDMEIISNASKEVREVSSDLNHALLAGIVLNSPFISALALVFILLLLCFYPIVKSVRVLFDGFKEWSWGATYAANAPA